MAGRDNNCGGRGGDVSSLAPLNMNPDGQTNTKTSV